MFFWDNVEYSLPAEMKESGRGEVDLGSKDKYPEFQCVQPFLQEKGILVFLSFRKMEC